MGFHQNEIVFPKIDNDHIHDMKPMILSYGIQLGLAHIQSLRDPSSFIKILPIPLRGDLTMARFHAVGRRPPNS